MSAMALRVILILRTREKREETCAQNMLSLVYNNSDEARVS